MGLVEQYRRRPPYSMKSRIRSLIALRALRPRQSRAEREVETMQGLIAMRRAGILRTIQAHGGRIQVEMSALPGQLRPIDWEEAETLVLRFRQGAVPKGIMSMSTAERK